MSFKTFDIGAPLAGRLGEALGTGLKSGYENLQKRLLEKEKQQAKQYNTFLDQYLSKSDPETQKAYVNAQIEKTKPGLSQGDQEYVKSIQNNFTTAKKNLGIINRVREKLPGASIGPTVISKFDPKAQAIKSEVGTLFKTYEALYKGGRISDQKFKYIKELLPNIWDTPEVFEQKLQSFESMLSEDLEKGQKFLQLRNQHGRIPENIFELLESPEMNTNSDLDIETAQEQILGTPTQENTLSTSGEGMPTKGTKIRNKTTGEVLEWTGSRWKKVKR